MKFKLEPDELDSGFEGWAFLLFRSPAPAYLFADILNRLYDYRLSRIDDMQIENSAWPFFVHDDPVKHLYFYLTEQPSTAIVTPWSAGDKLLVIKGDAAPKVASSIHSDFSSTPHYDEGDLLAKEHARLLDTLQQEFTVAILLDFDTPATTKKAAKEWALAEHYCDTVIGHIEANHLDLSVEERMRLKNSQ